MTDLINKFMNDDAVCSTAPATLGLLVMLIKLWSVYMDNSELTISTLARLGINFRIYIGTRVSLNQKLS